MPNVSLVDGHIDGKQTNYDRIRQKSIKEMAEFLAEQVIKQEIHYLTKENPNITATHIEFIKQTLFRGYLRYLESEVDTK